nr:hypothetical protein [Tanacetum cinerariifolium]
DKDDDDNDDEEDLAKNDDEDTESGKGGDEPNGPQECSSVSSFVTSMLNPISDAGVESIFTTASSLIVSLQTPTPIMTPSTIATITTSGDAPIPPTTIPSIILKNLPTFNSAFCFDERLRSLETTFSEYRQTNLFVDVVSAIPGIVHQYMTQQMTEAVREAVQIQTDRLQDSVQRENDEFLRNIDDNMKKIIKGQVKNQVKEQVSRILPRIEESMNATLEAEVLTRSSHSSRTSYAIAADLSEMELKKILIEKMEGNKSIQRLDEQQNLYKASTTGSQSRQLSAIESAFTEEPVQTTCQMEEPPHLVFQTGADDQLIVQTSQHPEWFSQPRRPPLPNLRRDDDKIYKFKEGDFKRLRLQDIEDMLLLLVQGKLSNLTVEERFAFNVSLRMFTRSTVIKRRVEDLQLEVESYQKKLNLTKPDTYRTDLRRQRIRREHADYINRMEMLFIINPHPHPSMYANTNVESFSSLPIPIQDSNPRQEEIDVVAITNDVLPPSVENEDSDEEVVAVNDLRVNNSSLNSEHEYSESEDSYFDNPPVPLPPPEPPDEEFDFEIEFENKISVVRSAIVKFECIDPRVSLMILMMKMMIYLISCLLSLIRSFFLSAESEDTIFDPGISD